MSKQKHEEYEKKNEKWRMASTKAIDIRYALDDILNSFTEEEKKTERYQQFLTTVSQQFDHLLGDRYKNKIDEDQEKLRLEQAKLEEERRNNGWVSYKSAIIAAAGAAAVALIQVLPQLITSLFTIFGGSQ